MDTSARNRVIARAVEVLGIGEIASRLHISETMVRTYAIGDESIPDPTWLLAVSYLLERLAEEPIPQFSNLL
jgi:hypothetical protein